MNKELFGYDKEIQRYLQYDDKSIPKGSFLIQNRSGKYYWYYNLSSGKNRLIYLCSVDDKGKERNSFLYSIYILKKKLKNRERISGRGKNSLIKVIDNYIVQLRDEGGSNKRGVERTKKTIQDIISHIRKFRDYVEKHPIGIKDMERDGFKDYVSNFINHLIDSGLKPNSIRVILVHFRQFLDELVEPRKGEQIISYHPITPNYIKTQYSVNIRDRKLPSFYTEDKYIHLLQLCSKEIKRVWREYIKNPEISVDKKEGIYFTSILQLLYGFRIGEIVSTYINEEMKEKHHKTKGGYSFLKKVDERGYIFQIYWKRKFGSVFVDFDIFSWVKPPSTTPYREELLKENHKKPTYSTNIIDVIFQLYPDDINLFPINVDTIRKYFKSDILNRKEIENMGLNGTHDLRDMMINYELHTKGTSFVDLSQMTRNKIQTIEKYYLHTSNELSISKSKKLNTKNRLSEINKILKKEE